MTTATRTSPTTWAMLGACVAIGALATMSYLEHTPAPQAACPPLPERTLLTLLGDDQRASQADYLRTARSLHLSGLCVLEGGHSAARGDFWFAVQPTGERARIVRFTRDELRR